MWYIKKFYDLTLDELYEIFKLRIEVFVIEQECLYQDADEKDKHSYHLFYKENNQIVAYARIIEKGYSFNETSVGRVIVAPSERKKGLGRKLLNKAIEFINNSLNETLIRIEAQVYLKKFYKSLGFVVASDEFLDDGIAHIEMLLEQKNR